MIDEIVSAYCTFARAKKRCPTFEDLYKLKITRASIRTYFGGIKELHEYVKRKKLLSGELIDLKILDTSAIDSGLIQKVAQRKKFVITTAVSTAPIHREFLAAINTYCDKNDAQLLILVCADPQNVNSTWFDPELPVDCVVLGELKLNEKIRISDIKLSAKQLDPATGLLRIAKSKGSFIFGSPKLRLKFAPASDDKYSHAIMTTGALTKASYRGRQSYIQHRLSNIAEFDHMIGAIIVEIQDTNTYHFRQVQADTDGSFCDYGKRYHPKGRVVRENPVGFVMGDLHPGDMDEKVLEGWLQIIEELNPESIFLHDVWNGHSCNPHEKGRPIERARRNRFSVEDEARLVRGVFNDIASRTPGKKKYIVRSNHDEFLDRWLESFAWKDDPINFDIGLELTYQLRQGKHALEYLLYSSAGSPKDMIFLKQDQDVIIEGIYCSAHGHAGPNGAWATAPALEDSYGKCTTAHTHTPEIFRNVWRVGTTTKKRVGYNKGPSSWMNTSQLIYKGGARQNINIINGKWKI